MFGLGCYYALGIEFELALVVFLGASYLLQIIVNLMLLPYIQKYLMSTFD